MSSHDSLITIFSLQTFSAAAHSSFSNLCFQWIHAIGLNYLRGVLLSTCFGLCLHVSVNAAGALVNLAHCKCVVKFSDD